MLTSLDDQRDIDWREGFNPGHFKPATVEAVDDADRGKTTETWSGRPYREEAMLIQIKGSVNDSAYSKRAGRKGYFESYTFVRNVHRGVCGCCVSQSKAMESFLVLEAVQAEAAATKALLDAKDVMREKRKRKNSNLVKLTSDDVQHDCAKCTKPLPFLALEQRLPTLSLQAQTLASLKQIMQY